MGTERRPSERTSLIAAPRAVFDVLVVEDDADVARAVADVLTAAGYRTRVATDGDEALAACEHATPDAIVLDHNLPVMTGEQFLEEIRWRPALSRVPVVLVSALGELPAIARRLHVQHFLTKPVSPDALVATLARVVAGISTVPPRP